MSHMAQDKKVKRGKLTFILVKGIGRAFIANDVPADTVEGLPQRRASGNEPAAGRSTRR